MNKQLCDCRCCISLQHIHEAYYIKINLLLLKDKLRIRINLLEHTTQFELSNGKEMRLHAILAAIVQGYGNLWSRPTISFHSHSHKQAGEKCIPPKPGAVPASHSPLGCLVAKHQLSPSPPRSKRLDFWRVLADHL